MQIKAVLFDMDGLMFDTERLSDIIWHEIGKRFGYTLTAEHMALLRGRNREGGKQAFLAHFGAAMPYDALWQAVMDEFEHRMAVSVPFRPYLTELLDFLKAEKIPMAVASSTHRALVENHLRVAGLCDYFKAIVCGDMVENGKPAPDIYLLAAKTLGVSPADCMVLEDSCNGMRAGAAAGCFSVMVPDLDPVTDEMRTLAAAIVPSLHEVIDLIKEKNHVECKK